MTKNEARTVSSDFNLQKLNPVELQENLLCTIESGGNAAIFGRRGGGKTHISKQAIQASGTKEVYLNISTLERVDLGGYPDMLSARDKNENKGYLNFIMPWFFRHLIEGKEKVVLLLDEVDKGDPSLWAPLLEIVQFRSCNGRELPNLQSCLMTGNLAAEGGQRPSLPLLDRAEKYLFESNTNQWLDWAGRTREIHSSISAYIYDHPDHLFGEVDDGDAYASASPRGWHNASKLLNFGEENNWKTDLMVSKVCGCVGKQLGLQFKNYYDHYQFLLPMVDRIFKGQNVKKEFDKMEPTKKIVCSMIVCARFANILDGLPVKKHDERAATVAKFLIDVDVEIALIAVRSQVNISRVLSHSLDEETNWNKLLDKINDKLK